MKWKSTKDDAENQIYARKESPDGKMFIGTHPVLFGARIRAGYVGDPLVEIDWCCGDNLPLLSLTYHMLLNHMENGGTFEELPSVSMIKPWYMDLKFIESLDKKLKTDKTRLNHATRRTDTL